jgi:hypothetical protein
LLIHARRLYKITNSAKDKFGVNYRVVAKPISANYNNRTSQFKTIEVAAYGNFVRSYTLETQRITLPEDNNGDVVRREGSLIPVLLSSNAI